jgi:hypothetical protein
MDSIRFYPWPIINPWFEDPIHDNELTIQPAQDIKLGLVG